MIRSSVLLTAMLIAAPSAPAQVRLPVQPPIRTLSVPPRHEAGDSQPVPREYRPPPGMCRIWLEGVPASQQPAPTDCASAVRNRPNNGRVLFGDDYVGKDRDKDRKDRKNDKRPDQQADAGAAAAGPASPAMPAGAYAFAPAARPHGPSADDEVMMDARHELVPGVVASVQPPTRQDSARARPRSPLDRDARRRRDSTLSERRRAIRERDRTRDRHDDPDDDDDDPDDRGDRRGGDRRGPDARGDGRTGERGPGYGSGYYPPYPPPARANGVCLDRDGDGWCDDTRGGSQYCLDRDGDGRCDDYADLASAPYASSMPSMAAAMDVRRGIGSPIALRWLGTAEVIVRTSELRRTGTPYRAMWLDANTNRLLQVWTDRDGDGIADRVEIYRNGRIAKTIGR